MPDLPENLSRWPTSPHEILGVKRNASASEIVMAYAVRVRRYKPDFHPDEYRRIRDAFEALRGPASLKNRVRAGASSAAPSDAPLLQTPPKRPHDARTRQEEPLRENVLDPIDEHWARALAGDLDGAYRRLSTYADDGRGGSRCYAMLYWLLTVEPRLASSRPAHSWLTRGIRAGGGEMLLKLLVQELKHSPETMIESMDLDAARDADEQWAPSLIRRRCLAAARAGAYSKLAPDVAYLEAKLAEDGETWFRFLLQLFDQLAFPSCQEGAKWLQVVWERMEGLSELHLELGEQLLRLERYAELAQICSQVQEYSTSLPALAASTAIRVWRDGCEGLAYHLEPIAARIAANATGALGELSRFANTPFTRTRSGDGQVSATGRQLLDYLNDVLFKKSGQQPPIKDLREATVLRRYFESRQFAHGDTVEEMQLLRFLRRQCISPRHFVDAVEMASRGDLDGNVSESLKRIRSNSALAFCWQVLVETDAMLDA